MCSGEDPWHTVDERRSVTAMKGNITDTLSQAKRPGIGSGKLYRVDGTRSQAVVLVECIPSAKNLNSGECFVIDDAGSVLYIWHGGGATEKDKALARKVPDILDRKVHPLSILVTTILTNIPPGISAWAPNDYHKADYYH